MASPQTLFLPISPFNLTCSLSKPGTTLTRKNPIASVTLRQPNSRGSSPYPASYSPPPSPIPTRTRHPPLAASKSLFFAAIGDGHLLPPGPPNFSAYNPTPLFRRKLPKLTTLTSSLRPNKCKLLLAASSPPPLPPIPTQNHTHSTLTGSTRTITTVFTIALTFSKQLASKISLVLPLNLAPFLPVANNTLATLSRPAAFFAAISDSSAPRSMGAPIAVIAAGLAKWLEIYSCVLLIRVLLSWFPNIPWDKQPMSAIRDLCDPYLSLFRGIIPPLFNSLDVSPILAFLLLGMLGQLARPPRPF